MPNYEDQPVLSDKVQQRADDGGNVLASSSIEDAANAIDPRTVEFILYGVFNSSFARGPQLGPNTNIEPEINPLPDWPGPVQVSGGAITCSWVADASSPSGYNLRFTIAPGAAGDEAYVEQIVPIGGVRARRFGYVLRGGFYRVTASGGTPQATVSSQYLTAAFATTGSASSGTADLGVDATVYVGTKTASSAGPPADAAFLRIRIGVKRNTMAATDTATLDVTEVRLERGFGAVWLADASSPATYGVGVIAQAGGGVIIQPDYYNGSGGGIQPSLALSAADGTIIYTAVTGYHRLTGGPIQTQEQAAPSTPASGYYSIYAKSDGILYGKNDAGTEVALGGGASDHDSLTGVSENDHGRWTDIITKPSDESVATSTVLQNDDDFFFTTVNLAHYEFEMVILYINTVGNTGDLKMVFGEDTNNRGAAQSIGIGAADTATTQNAVTDQTETIILGAATGERTAIIRGAFRGAGGTWRLKWAQNSSSGTTKILTGSVFRYRRIV